MKYSALLKAFSTMVLLSCIVPLFAETKRVVGTGRTTGHIAMISVTNTFPNSIFLVNTGKKGVAALSFYDPVKNNYFAITLRHNDQSAMVLIPSNGANQSYIATGVGIPSGQNENGEIKPGASVTIPIIGYCADIRRPPVPAGEQMPPISQWVHSNDVSLPNEVIAGNGGFYHSSKYEPEFVAINIPGQIVSKPVIIDQHINPVEAAPFLFDAINKISITADILQSNNLIKTPFSGNHEREREAIIQQTIWIYSSALTGNTYNKKDFADQMTTQYEQNSGNKITKAPPEAKEQIDAGVDDFWNSFTLVGVEAKVISAGVEMSGSTIPQDIKEKLENAFGDDLSGVNVHRGDAAKDASDSIGSQAYETGGDVQFKDGTPSLHTTAEELAHVDQGKKTAVSFSDDAGAAAETTDADKVKKRCRCKEYSATIVVVDGDPDATKPGREVIELEARVNNQGSFPESDEHVVDYNYSLKKGDTFSVTFSDIKLSCDCEETPCTTIHNKDPHVSAASTLSKALGKIDIKNTNFESKVLLRDKKSKAEQSGTGATFKFTAQNGNTASETLHFQLHAFCSNEDCSRDRCLYKVRIKLNINQPEKK